MNSGVYIIKSKLFPFRKYIGSSINFERRKKRHLSKLRSNIHENQKLQNHFNKFGEKDLIFEIILFCPWKSLTFWEQIFIDGLKPYFNINPVATSRLGAKFSEESKQKLKQAKKLKGHFQPYFQLRK